MPVISSTRKNSINAKRRLIVETVNNVNTQKYPKVQNGETVGSREVVENRKAIATRVEGDILGRKSVGLTDDDITQKVIVGQKSRFNELNLAQIKKRGNSTVLKVRDDTILKTRNISKVASEGAKKRNNWIIYVKQVQLHQRNFNLPVFKYPELVGNPILQAFYHMKIFDSDNNSNLRVSIAPYVFAMIYSERNGRLINEIFRKIDEKPENPLDREINTSNNLLTRILNKYREMVQDEDINIINRGYYIHNINKLGWNRFENYENMLSSEDTLLDGVNFSEEQSDDFNHINNQQKETRIKKVKHKTIRERINVDENLIDDFLALNEEEMTNGNEIERPAENISIVNEVINEATNVVNTIFSVNESFADFDEMMGQINNLNENTEGNEYENLVIDEDLESRIFNE